MPALALRAGPGPYLRITFEDHGSGISEENLTRIFDPFYTTKEGQHGTGLGLSSAYGAVQQHGGSIAATSRLGEGTVFTIDLPLVDSVPARESMPTLGDRQLTVLLIEDESVVRTTARLLLERMGHRVLGFTREADLGALRREGLKGFLRKPFTRAQLVKALGDALGE